MNFLYAIAIFNFILNIVVFIKLFYKKNKNPKKKKNNEISKIKSENIEFKKKVKMELINRNLSVKELAKQCDVSYVYLYDLINGNRTGSPTLAKIKKILEI